LDCDIITKKDLNIKGKVCLLGDNAVGKTSLIRRYVLDIFEDKYLATIGTNITKKSLRLRNPKDNTRINMSILIWDIMGDMTNLEELIHSYTKYSAQQKYFENAKAGIVVCDITRPNTLKNIDDWVSAFFEVTGEVPIIFLGNKADLQPVAKVSNEDLGEIAAKYKSRHLFTSAKDGQNVELAFSKIAKSMALELIKSQE
jgi:small GTP-binding protein